MKTNTRKVLTCLTALTMALPQFPAFHANAVPLPQKSPEPVSAPAPAVTEYPAATTYGNMGTDHCCTTDCWETTAVTMSRTDISDWEKLFGTTTTTSTTWRTDQCSDLSYGFTTYGDYGESTTTTSTTVTSGCDDYVKRLKHTFDPSKDHSKYEEDAIWLDWDSLLEYQVGEELDLTEIRISGAGHYYDEGMETDMYWDIFSQSLSERDDYEIDYGSYNPNKPGKYELTLYVYIGLPDAYGGKCTFTVEVLPSVTTCDTAPVTTTTTTTTTTTEVHDHTPHHGVGSADILPVKKVFQIGEELDFSDAGAFVCGHIEDAYGEHIIYWDNFNAYPLSHYDYDMDASAFDNTKPGKYTILFTLHMSGGEFGVPDFDIHTSCEVEVTDSVVTTGNDSVLTTTTVTTTTSQNRMYFAPNTGDVNGDKDMDIRDAVLLARIVGGDTTAESSGNSQADINRDQHVNAMDLTLLLFKLAHLI